jgi:hypothetical protein
MNHTFGLGSTLGGTIALVCSVIAPPAFGADARSRDVAQVAQAHASLQASAAGARSAAGAMAPNEIYANDYRAYPPSCLVDGLPFGQFDAARGGQSGITLLGDPAACLPGGSANECNFAEADTVKVWRVPCSGSKSATLVEIDRPANHDMTLYPTLPGIYVIQGSKPLFIRYANDPNTFLTTTYTDTPLPGSDIFVLENFYGGATQIDYNQAFTLVLDNFTGNTAGNPVSFNFPVYNKADYPNASLTLPISGYMTSNWFDPQHGGEGILTQVFDNGDKATRTFTAAWYTFDKTGLPFWLFAQGTFHIGDRTTGSVDTYFPTGGCFAGVNCDSATFTKWGTITFTFPDCDHMAFNYSGNADAVNGPTGTGSRNWLRIANVNSLFCN